MGETPVMGSPAALLARHERLAVFRMTGDAEAGRHQPEAPCVRLVSRGGFRGSAAGARPVLRWRGGPAGAYRHRGGSLDVVLWGHAGTRLIGLLCNCGLNLTEPSRGLASCRRGAGERPGSRGSVSVHPPVGGRRIA